MPVTEGLNLSDELSKLPPNIQERLLRLQQLQQTLQSILAQKQQVEMEKSEVEQTLMEMAKTADDVVIYKAIGSLLVKSDKVKVSADLNERKDLLVTRSTVIAKQEERVRSQVKETQSKLQEDINPVAGQQ
ncbi:MAG: prefoldin subunit beta [Candidatus Bathyarchaeota archaeon]|nr:prefoldin subunit beta [Candidatus Termiticorpusculum sp.]MCL2867981.1 prefoldin subunit beta [Candidatus Termiticorpusculum sp.]